MQPFVLENSCVAAAEVTVLETSRVPNGHIFTSMSIMAMDADNAIATLIEIGILDGTRRIPIDSTPGGFPAATSMTIYWPCMCREGQSIYAKFVTPFAGDHLQVVAHGYVERICPVQPPVPAPLDFGEDIPGRGDRDEAVRFRNIGRV